MTVENVPAEITYAYTAPNQFYDYPFRVFTEDEVKASLLMPNGSETFLVPGTDYTVLFIDSKIVVGKVLDDYTDVTLRIFRQIEPTQETVYVNNSPLDVKIIESDFDKVIMLIQELETSISNLKLSPAFKGDFIGGDFYSRGDIVKYNGNYYSKLVDGVAADPFDPNEWALYLDVVGVADKVIQQIGFNDRPSKWDMAQSAKTVTLDTATMQLHLTFDPAFTVGSVGSMFPRPVLVWFKMPDDFPPSTRDMDIAPRVTVDGSSPIQLIDRDGPIQYGKLQINKVYTVMLYSLGGVDVAYVPNTDIFTGKAVVSNTDPNNLTLRCYPELPNLSYTTGTKLTFKAVQVNTGPMSVVVHGLTYPLRDVNGDDIVAGAIQAGQLITIVCFPSECRLTHPVDQYYLPKPNHLDQPNVVTGVTGAPNTKIVSMANEYTSWFDGMEFVFTPNNANAGPVTIALDWPVVGAGSLPSIPLETWNGPLTAGDITPSRPVAVRIFNNKAYYTNPPIKVSDNGFMTGDAVWDVGNNRYNVATGNGLTDANVAVNQHFRIIPDADNPSGGTSVKIDGMTPRTIKYQYKSSKYDLLAGEVAQNAELLIRWDGTDFVAVGGLAVPDIVETANGPTSGYVSTPVGVSFDAPLASISGSGQLATLASNVLTIQQPGLYEQRGRGGFNYAGAAINFSGDTANSDASTTGYQEHTMTRVQRMESGDTVSLKFYLYNGASYYSNYSELGVRFLGRL